MLKRLTIAVRVLESTPAANAHIRHKSSAFFVRFDRPVDHRKATMVERGERHTR